MKLIRRSAAGVVFGLGVREKTLFERLLGFYPVHPTARPRLSRESPGKDLSEAEALLHEALDEQHKALSGWIQLRLTEGEALSRTGSGWRLTLNHAEVESLLQVLNEMRVGSWMRLGSPENLDDPAIAESAGTAPFHAIMTVAGQFEMVILMALDSAGNPAGATGPSEPSGEPG